MPTAEIITIGTEIMLGEIIDTNAPYIARKLRDVGVGVRRTWSTGDYPDDIAGAIREATQRAEIIITTGGLGPTVDDPTREAAAKAFGVQTEFREDLWQQVIDRFARFNRYPTENNKQQACVPQGATAIENPVGTAPAFMVEFGKGATHFQSALHLNQNHPNGVVICLPGVPREMEHLLEHNVLPHLRQRFQLNSVTVVRVLHTAGVGESQIDERIGDLEKLANPIVGLAAHSGQVDVRISANAATEAGACALIQEVETEIRQRLGSWVYGADDETLEELAVRILQSKGWRMVVVEAGLEGKLLRRFAGRDQAFLRGEAHPAPPGSLDEFMGMTHAYRKAHEADVALGVAIRPGLGRGGDPGQNRSLIFLVLVTPEKQKSLSVPYGGPPKLAHRRAVNLGMNLLRKA